MIQIDSCVSKSLLAGVTIGIGGLLYLASFNIILGAILLASVLIGTNLLNLNSFTDKSGFISDSQDARRLVLVLCLNMVAAFIFGLIVKLMVPGISKSADAILFTQLNTGLLSIIIKSLVAGFLITLAIEAHSNSKHILSLLYFMGLIVTDCTHCILSVFYYVVSYTFYNDIEWFILQLLLIIVFNFIGSILYNLFVNRSIIHKFIE